MHRYSMYTFITLALTAGAGIAGAQQKGTPYYGRTDPSQYRTVEYGGGALKELTLVDGRIMGTNLLFIKSGIIPPGLGIGEHRHNRVEEMYIALDGPAEFTVNGRTAFLPAGSSAVCPPGSSHALKNPNDRPLAFMTVAVAKEKGVDDGPIVYGPVPSVAVPDSPPPFRWTLFDRTLLRPVGPAHKGRGLILNRRPWLDGAFETNWGRVGHCLLPPGTSIGYHRHDRIEEVYCVLAGKGRSTANGVKWEVRAGDAIPCTLHDSHGIANTFTEPLDLFVVNVTLEREVFEATDHGDDLMDK